MQFRREFLRVMLSVLIAAPAIGSGVLADTPAFSMFENSLSCPDSVRARDFLRETLDSDLDDFLIVGGSSARADTARCGCQVTDQGRTRKGVNVDMTFALLDVAGETTPIATRSARTRRNGIASFQFPWPDVPGVLVADVELGGRKQMNELDCWCSIGTASTCEEDGQTLCLDGDRFQVQAFSGPEDGGTAATVVDRGGNEGLFSFFPLADADLLVRILDNCSDVNFTSYWVFYAATTGVEFTLSVVDTVTGAVQHYGPGSRPGEAILDTGAFHGCP